MNLTRTRRKLILALLLLGVRNVAPLAIMNDRPWLRVGVRCFASSDSDSSFTLESLVDALDLSLASEFVDERGPGDDVVELFQSSGRDLTKENLLCTRLPDLGLNRCHLAPDAYGGKGCFASRNLVAGELITCLPGDVVIHKPSGEAIVGEHIDVEGLEDAFASATNYQIVEGEDYTMFGLPTLCDDPSYLGHFANDGAKLEVDTATVERLLSDGDVLPAMSAEEAAAEAAYMSMTAERRNAEHTSLHVHMATVALRDIRKGEEVLVTYGADYWQAHAMREREPGY